MAHKVCIDGTAYEIDGGKAMVDGTVYEIDHGVANVGGTAYEVGFDDGMRTITIGKSSFLSKPTYGRIVVNGETFYGSTTEEQSMQVPIGTVIEVQIIGGHTKNPSAVIVNGETVATAADSIGTGAAKYEYTVKGDTMVSIANMTLPALEGTTTINVSKTTITITEIRNDPAMLTIQKASGKDPYSGNTISADATYAKVTINGAVYDGSSEVKLVLPAGTVIGCYVKTQKNGIANVEVWSGGKRTRVAEADTSGASTTYAYTVTGDATILVSRQYFSYDRSYFGAITITET